jgi:hypothetical protein
VPIRRNLEEGLGEGSINLARTRARAAFEKLVGDAGPCSPDSGRMEATDREATMHHRLSLALTAAALLAGCRQETPEGRIRKAFAGCVEAVEAGDASSATQRLSPRFTGPEGMDKGAARLFLMGILAREKVGVHVVAQDLTVRGAMAVQTVDLFLTGRAGKGLIPDEGSRRTYVIRWEREGGEWIIREIQESDG